jgi:hypothetical protein
MEAVRHDGDGENAPATILRRFVELIQKHLRLIGSNADGRLLELLFSGAQ